MMNHCVSIRLLWPVLLIVISLSSSCRPEAPTATSTEAPLFVAPDTNTIPEGDFGDMVRYGRQLVVNTAYYIGPDGIVSQNLDNKMTCNNCHLDAGTRAYAHNFFSSHARYPQYRGRENKILTLSQRINNCIERPHHGKPLPLDSKEMIAMTSYMRWIAEGVPTGQRVKGDNGIDLVYPDRAADPEKGALIYAQHCMSCHGKDGAGQWNFDSSGYINPPLWGKDSYEGGSSIHRVLKSARFIKANMPDKLAFWYKPVLTDEEAIDVAAFVNDDRIHPRPFPPKTVSQYENTKMKPIDYGSGPYADTFSEMQHKFGPFQPIIDYHKEHNLPVVF